MTNFCYDCGKEIENGDQDRDHIPAQCFYVGYGDEYKINRITVPAHKACNHKYSKIDQELRDAIGILTENQTDKAVLTSKSIRSILKRKDGKERISSENGKMFMEFNYGDLRDLHIKNFKGIFFKEYGFPIPDKFQIEIVTDGDQDFFQVEKAGIIYTAIDHELPEWNISGHADIFKYKIAVIGDAGLENFDINSDDQFLVGIIVYHEEIMCMVFAGTQHLINKMSPK